MANVPLSSLVIPGSNPEVTLFSSGNSVIEFNKNRLRRKHNPALQTFCLLNRLRVILFENNHHAIYMYLMFVRILLLMCWLVMMAFACCLRCEADILINIPRRRYDVVCLLCLACKLSTPAKHFGEWTTKQQRNMGCVCIW